jgi:hypothetical protein
LKNLLREIKWKEGYRGIKVYGNKGRIINRIYMKNLILSIKFNKIVNLLKK